MQKGKQRYKRVGYKMDIMRQSACLVVNPIMVYNYGFLFYCTTVRQTSDSQWLRLFSFRRRCSKSVFMEPLFVVSHIACGGSIFGSCFPIEYLVESFLVLQGELINAFLMSCVCAESYRPDCDCMQNKRFSSRNGPCR